MPPARPRQSGPLPAERPSPTRRACRRYWVGDEPEGQLSHTRVSQQQQRLDAAAVKLQAIRQEELPGS